MKYKVIVPIAGYRIVEVDALSKFSAINKGYDLVAEMLESDESLNPADRVKIQTSQEDIENGEYSDVFKLAAIPID